MNLVSETKRRLEYLNKELEDLNNFSATVKISGNAKDHLNSEICKTEKNIQYYSEILKVLEG
jgi:hypothetical protein